MATITLELPDDIVQHLTQLDSATITTLLRQVVKSSHIQPPTNLAKEQNGHLILLPAAPLPAYSPPTSMETWKDRLLTASAWSDEDIQEIESARDYINQWQPQSF